MTESELHDLIEAMTLPERVSLLSGEDFWSLPAIERLGIGKFRVSDGPNGARGSGNLFGGVKAASFPVGISLGATWNVALMREIGGALAEEARSKGAHMLLGPTINLQRSVTNGRNFECFSEDPILTAELASAYIAGLQAGGVGATPKHFVGNESEIERMSMSSDVDERALRELYLVPFEWAVKKAGTWGIMTAYNKLNGVFASEHNWLLTDVLRGDWGYDGVVMSDWFGSHSTAETVNAGLDLEMPGPPRDRGEALVAAVEAGSVPHETIRARVLSILRTMHRTGAFTRNRSFEELAEDRPEHRALIRRAGAEGTVLLRNEGLLPLEGQGRIAVIGPNAKVARIMGGGSSQINAHYRVSPWEGLVSALGEDRLEFALGATNHRFEPVVQTSLEIAFYDNRDFSGEPVATETLQETTMFWAGPIAGGKVDPRRFSAVMRGVFTPERSGTHRVGAYGAGGVKVYLDGALVTDAATGWAPGRTFFEQGSDEVVGEIALAAGRAYDLRIEFATRPEGGLGLAAFAVGIGLPLGPESIAEAAALAARCETAIVFVGRSGEWDTEGTDLDTIVLPGRQDELVSAVAAANPRTIVVVQTGGPVEMDWAGEVGAILTAWYPGQETGNAIADVLVGAAEPTGRLPQTFPKRFSDNPTHSEDREIYPGRDGRVRYAEGVFIGYRHYERAGIAPLFPFGFGLGYTRFALEALFIDEEGFESDGLVSVSAVLTNTGKRAGTSVVQLYVGDESGRIERPGHELKAFAKVTLEPGEARTVTLALDARAFAFFNEPTRHWTVPAGTFAIGVGFSSAEIVLEQRIARRSDLTLPV